MKSSTNCIIVNFEDLGSGSAIADVTFNALYEHENPLPNQRYGWEWFCAREEFCNLEQIGESKNQTNVLITFGGTDPRNLTTETINYLSQEKENEPGEGRRSARARRDREAHADQRALPCRQARLPV